ncbi:hypothetical protein L208DRAFT_1408046, partial [Tricholoma matsutake]
MIYAHASLHLGLPQIFRDTEIVFIWSLAMAFSLLFTSINSIRPESLTKASLDILGSS